MQNYSISVDCRDERHQKRFFPVGLNDHFKAKASPEYWYDKNRWYDSSQGNLDCCSDTMVAMHYVTPKEMYFLDYLIYRVHPFGIEKQIRKDLPRKFTLKEILNASDVYSNSSNFRKHKPVHYIELSEIFRRK